MNRASQSSFTVEAVRDALDRLVNAHKKLKAEPLHLAVSFQRPKSKHVHLFEILGGFGGGEPSSDRKFFEVGFGSTTSFKLAAGQELRLLSAISARWASLKSLRDSKKAGTATVLYQDDDGKKLWKMLA